MALNVSDLWAAFSALITETFNDTTQKIVFSTDIHLHVYTQGVSEQRVLNPRENKC